MTFEMMKTISLVFCLVVILAACDSGGSTASSPAPAVAGVDLSSHSATAIEGSNAQHVVLKDNLGYTVSEGIVEGGQLHGTWVEYHPGTHIPSKIVSYVNGVPNGPTILLDQRGQLTEKAGFINNQYHDVKALYSYGKAMEETPYVNGKINGIMRTYFDGRYRGKIQKEIGYKDGIQHGTFSQYNEEGKKIIEYEYKNGEKVSGGIVE